MARKRTRPETMLFLNLSVDGRITSHDSDAFDPDATWKNQPGIRAILQQFYQFNQPHMHALTTGGYMKNLGVNTRQNSQKKEDFSLIILDPDADLTPQGLTYLAQNITHLYLICLTTHPAVHTEQQTFTIISYPTEIDLNHAFRELYCKYHIDQLFIHSIAPLNADLLDSGLIDHLSVIISPLLVGGHGTPALQTEDVFTLCPLQFTGSQVFAKNYVNLRYDVLNARP